MSGIVEQNCGDISIGVYKCDSKSELLFRLKEFKKTITLCDEEAYACNFVLIKGRFPGQQENVGCGLLYGSSICPQIVLYPRKYLRWILLDCMLFLVDMHETTVILQQRLSSVFYDVICLNDGVIAVVQELGIEAFDLKGQRIWQIVGPDILVECRCEDERIICRFENGQVISHDL